MHCNRCSRGLTINEDWYGYRQCYHIFSDSQVLCSGCLTEHLDHTYFNVRYALKTEKDVELKEYELAYVCQECYANVSIVELPKHEHNFYVHQVGPFMREYLKRQQAQSCPVCGPRLGNGVASPIDLPEKCTRCLD